MALTSVVFPAPSSPEMVTTSGGVMARPSPSPHATSSASVQASRPCAARGGMMGACDMLSRASRAGGDSLGGLGIAPCANLEELIAQLRGELEVHGRRRIAHLLLEHLLEGLDLHDRVAA